MSIINSKTNKIRKEYTIKELIEKAQEMRRAYSMVAITAAGSGHTGGTLFIEGKVNTLGDEIYFSMDTRGGDALLV